MTPTSTSPPLRPSYKPPPEFVLKDSGERQSFDTGAVRDTQTGKGRFDLLSPFALMRVARVAQKGGMKYTDRNWEKGMPVSRFLDSALRHIFQYIMGMSDEDHLAQAAWNIDAAMHMEEMVIRGRLDPSIIDLPDFGRVDDPQPEPEGFPVDITRLKQTVKDAILKQVEDTRTQAIHPEAEVSPSPVG